MADSISKSQVGAQITTTSTHNAGEDATYILTNTVGQQAKLQVGTGTITIATAGTQATATVNYPMPFQKTPQDVVISITNAGSDAGYNSIQAASATATGFTVKANSYAAQTLTFSYIAIGV